MYRLKFLINILAVLILISGALVASEKSNNNPEHIVSLYIDAVKRADWKSVETFWLSGLVTKSKRMQIDYDNIYAKHDCASPLIYLQKDISSGKLEINAGSGVYDNNIFIVPISISDGINRIEHKYYLVKKNNQWLFTSPLHLYTEFWYQLETKYCLIRFKDSSKINNYAIAELDKFIESTLNYLDVSKERLNILKKEKIDYFLCNELEIEELTGYSIHGAADLQFDAVISRHLPHNHELVHLLYNYSLKELPLYTIPLLQEGIAVSLGGRWGKSPEVLKQLGHFLIENGFLYPDNILSKNDFETKGDSPDMTYPVSGLFVDAILSKYGPIIFETIYRRLSGSIEKVNRFTPAQIREILSSVCSPPWLKIMETFNHYRYGYVSSGLSMLETVPKIQPDMEIEEKNIVCRIWEQADNYIFEIENLAVNSKATILFKEKLTGIGRYYKSWMFEEHLPHVEYDGEKYGIDLSVNEIGLYNYYTNILTAKYIVGFYNNKILESPKEGPIRFSILKNLFDSDFDAYNIKFQID